MRYLRSALTRETGRREGKSAGSQRVNSAKSSGAKKRGPQWGEVTVRREMINTKGEMRV